MFYFRCRCPFDMCFDICRLLNTSFYRKAFWSARNTAIGVQTRIHFKVCMLKIIAASSLYNSIEELQISLSKQLRKLVHAGPSFSLNPESVNKSKDVYYYLKSEKLKNTRISLWHDLINNTITHHKRNNYQPQSVNQLVTSLKSLTNLCGIVCCQRTGSPIIFEDLRILDCPIIQVTTDILSKSEQRSEVLVEKYKAIHQSSNLELRFLGVALHYYPNLRKILKTRGTKRRTHEQRREAKRKREDK